MSKKASSMVEGQVVDFGFAKNAPAPKEREEKKPTVIGRYDKETDTYWFGFKKGDVRPSRKTMIIVESEGVEVTTLRAPNDKGETVNIIGSFRFMVPMSDAWVKKQAKAAKESGE